MVRTKLFLLLIFLCYGCASLLYTQRSIPEVITDDFETDYKILGITQEYQVDKGFALRIPNYFYIRSWVNKQDLSTTHQLYVVRTYGYDWHFYDRAVLSGGEALGFTEIDSEVPGCSGGDCSFRETFGIDITNDLLEANRDGFDVKVSSRSGNSFVISITKQQIDSQLDWVNRVKDYSK